jgi:ABC-type branched-subunit amino acid transport system permease subunit
MKLRLPEFLNVGRPIKAVFGGVSARTQPVTQPTGRFLNRHQSLSVIVGMSIVTALLPFIILLPPFNGFGNQTDFVDGFAQAGVWVLLAVGLNVVVGLAGLLDLGYAAFFAIGAYTYAYGASPFSHNHIPFWPMLIVGAAVAAIFGLLLGAPTLRLRGDYLAIVTLGFGEIVPVVFNNSDTYTNGTNGITALYQPAIPGLFPNGFGFGNPVPYYITVAVIIAVAMILLYRLQDSRLGRAWMAVREDELAAASMGINTVTTKLLAFAIGASTSGLAGVYLSSKLAIVSPTQFGFTVSFTVLAMVVLGGMGNIWGVAVGAFVIYELQSQGLKQLNNFFATNHQFFPAIHLGFLNIDLATINFLNYQYLLYGLALVAMMLLRPEGLFPSRRRRAELHDTDDAAASNQELVEA